MYMYESVHESESVMYYGVYREYSVMQAASVGNRPEMRLEYPMSSSANLVFARARCMVVRQGMHGVREALVTPVCQGAGEMSATEDSV